MTYQGLNPRNILPEVAVHIGGLPKWRYQSNFANTEGISTSLVDIWPANTVKSYLTAAETMDITSTSPNDTNSSGSGARTIRIVGLDNNFDEIQEDINMNGTGTVVSTNSYIRVFKAQVLTVGASGFNEGTININATTATSLEALIAPQLNQTTQSQYTVPNGYYAAIGNLMFSAQIADAARIYVDYRPFGEIFRPQRFFNIYQQVFQDILTPTFLAAPKSDLRIRAIKTGGAGTVECSCSYGFYLIPEAQVV